MRKYFNTIGKNYYWWGAKHVTETTHTSTVLSSSVPADAVDNTSIISSGTMNAKLPLLTAVVQFLPVKALVVYT